MSLDHRKDNRTIEEFSADIKRDTEREKVAANILKYDLEKRGHSVILKDFGVDNSGELVTGRVEAKPDYEFIIDQKNLVAEIKVHSNNYPCMTFKVCDLKTYLKYNACIFVIVEDGYYVFSTKAIEHLLENYKGQIYENFSPNDLAIRIDKGTVSVFILASLTKNIKWHSETVNIIKENNNIFNRRKRNGNR